MLLTGHSHQAWPDVAFDAQQRAWLDAAELVDDKWHRAAAVADQVRAGWRRLLNEPSADIALGQNTHELVVRLLSAVLPMFGSNNHRPDSASDSPSTSDTRRRLITTDGEFHTIRRQLDRLAEAGVAVTKVASRPVNTLSERLARAVDDRTACVLVSSVLFETAEIVPDLHAVAAACSKHGAALLVDAYHHLNVVPFDLRAMGLTEAFVVGGGYKYCQLGEGNCFLRIPPDCRARPVLTGWFSEFGALSGNRATGEVHYDPGPGRFAGATYDPTSHYRGAAVFAFHDRMGLTPERLRAVSQHQTSLLAASLDALDLNPAIASRIEIAPDRRAGFVAVRTPAAPALVGALRSRGVFADSRGEILRLGPAPYVSDAQLRNAVEIFGDAARRI